MSAEVASKSNLRNPLGFDAEVEVLESIPATKLIDCYAGELDFDPSEGLQGISEISVCRCTASGYRFFHPPLSEQNPDIYDHLLARWGEEKYYAALRWEHAQALEEIEAGQQMLEIGCGVGNFLKKVGDLGVNAQGLELNTRAVSRCHERELSVSQETIEHFAARSENASRFDVVCSFQVLEHITDPGSFLRAAIETLKPGGRLIIGVPNNNPFLYGRDKFHTLNLPPHHYGLWNSSSLKKTLSLMGLAQRWCRVEPIDHVRHWMRVQLEHFIPPLKGTPVTGLLTKGGSSLPLVHKLIQGRNVVAVFQRPEELQS